jgi:hypothetical protein
MAYDAHSVAEAVHSRRVTSFEFREQEYRMESQQGEHNNPSYPEVSWDDLDTPGFYVSRSTGNGYRVPSALIKGAPPVIEQFSAKPSRLVRLSENAFISLIEARSLAANCNIEPNF